MKWYDKIDWGPFMWFMCFLALIGLSMAIPEGSKIASDLLLIAAGAVGPRIRSSKPTGAAGQVYVDRQDP